MFRKLVFGVIIAFVICSFSNLKPMQINAGIVTPHLGLTKEFYCEKLGFTVIFESDWFILLKAPDSDHQISFLQPNHASQQPIFQSPFGGKGVYLTVEVDNLEEWYERVRKKGIKIEVDIREEPWGDRHFAFYDPNGVAIDIVKYSPR